MASITLTQYVESLGSPPAREFRPTPFICEESDSLTLYFENQASYGDRIDNFLTVFKSFETDEVVGFELKGIARKMRDLHAMIINAKTAKVHVRLIIMTYIAETPANRELYDDLMQKSSQLDDAAVPVGV